MLFVDNGVLVIYDCVSLFDFMFVYFGMVVLLSLIGMIVVVLVGIVVMCLFGVDFLLVVCSVVDIG